MYHEGPKCQNIFKSSISGVTLTDHCNASGPDVGSDVVRLPAIVGAMLLTILLNVRLKDVSDVLVDPECPTSSIWIEVGSSCRPRNGSDCMHSMRCSIAHIYMVVEVRKDNRF